MPICRPWDLVKHIGACNVPFVLVFVFGNSFVKKAGIFRPLWYKKVGLLFIKRPFFPSRFTFNVRHFAKGYVRLGCKIGPDAGKSVKRSQTFAESADMSDWNRARIGSPFTRADLLHDFWGPTNRHDKSQRVNIALLYYKTRFHRGCNAWGFI